MVERICSPCVEGQLIEAIIIIAKFAMGIAKTGRDFYGCRFWEITVYHADMFLQLSENSQS
jgi:hypothetical protein